MEKSAQAFRAAKRTLRRCPHFIGESGERRIKKKTHQHQSSSPFSPQQQSAVRAPRGPSARSLPGEQPAPPPCTCRPPYLCISPTHPRRLAGTPAPRHRSTRRERGSQPWPGAASAAHRPARLPKASSLGNGQEAKKKIKLKGRKKKDCLLEEGGWRRQRRTLPAWPRKRPCSGFSSRPSQRAGGGPSPAASRPAPALRFGARRERRRRHFSVLPRLPLPPAKIRPAGGPREQGKKEAPASPGSAEPRRILPTPVHVHAAPEPPPAFSLPGGCGRPVHREPR